MAEAILGDFVLDDTKFLALLTKVIGEAEFVQNNASENVPTEDRVARHVLEVLEPLSTTNGGPLEVQHISFVEGRGNIIVTYKGTEEGSVISFVGAHMDVVTANPDGWDFPPFKLTVDGDKLCGRGTTDCLGHVALLTELFRQLGERRPKLRRTVVGVWIANEENAFTLGVGIDALVDGHHLDHLTQGPLYWVDTADSKPCIGTGGIAAWQLTAYGKLFHSGLPHKAINPLELAMEALQHIQARFYKDFPPHPEEEKYGFATGSTCKPTQWAYPAGSINQIPGECSVSGDLRLTPFYDILEAVAKLKSYVDDLNADLSQLPTRGPWSKYTLPDEGLKGSLELKVFDNIGKGVACNLESPGYHAMLAAFREVWGDVQPYSITGSLPCIRDLQEAGYDVQTFGFGKLAAYHAVNEYALLSDFKKGLLTLASIIKHNE